MKLFKGETPLADRLRKLEDWIMSKDSDLLECALAAGSQEGQAMRVIMRRSAVHPRAEDEAIELPFAFRWIFVKGMNDGAAAVRYEIKRALEIDRPSTAPRKQTGGPRAA